MPGNCIVVGISGATNSGKTTLTQKLLHAIPDAEVIYQDSYFLEPRDERLEYVPELCHHNYDTMNALEMDHMLADVQAWLNKHSADNLQLDSLPVLVIEGFLIFNYKPLLQLFDKKYFVTIDEETCRSRRSLRTYNPPDVPGYFEVVVWPTFQKYFEELKDDADIVYLSGTEPQEKAFHHIFSDLRALNPGMRVSAEQGRQ